MQSLTCTRSKSKQDLQQQQARHISNSNLGMFMQQKQMHHAAKAFQCRLLLPVQVTPQAGDCFPSSSCGQVTMYPKCVAAGLSHDQQGAENVWLQVCPTTSRVLKWDIGNDMDAVITLDLWPQAIVFIFHSRGDSDHGNGCRGQYMPRPCSAEDRPFTDTTCA